MKRRVFWILMMALLLAAASASAFELSFAQTCWHKTSRAVTLYVQADGQGDLIDVGTLPAGFYVRPTGDTMDGKDGIAYNFETYGYIDGSAIVSCSQSVALPDGTVVQVPEAIGNNKSALNLYLEAEYGITLSGGTYTDGSGAEHELNEELTEEELAALEGEAKYLSAKAKAAKKNGFSTPTVYRDDNGAETPVQVVSMGLARSRVVLNGEEQLVDTWRLSWETEAPEDKVLAVITPKDSPNVRMRTAESEKATILDRIQTTRVVQVIKIGKNWTLVDTNDDLLPRGYISTPVLSFYPNIRRDYRPAMIAINGSAKAKGPDNMVRIREKGSGKSREVTKFDLGEPLTVLTGEDGDEWLEVDVGGFHAFIQSQFVSYTAENSGVAAKKEEAAATGETAGNGTAAAAEYEEPEEKRGNQLIP